MHHKEDQSFIQIYFLFSRRSSYMKVDQALTLDLLTRVFEYWPLQKRIRRIQINIINFKSILNFTNGVQIMRVSQKCLIASYHILGQLVPLNKIRVECIQNENVIILRCVRKVRPVEAISHVKLIDAGAFVRFIFLNLIVTLTFFAV